MSKKRESRYVGIARLALQIAEASLPRYAHPKSPQTYTLPQLAACVLLKVYLQRSYRDTEEWLLASDAVCAVLGLDEQVPDYSTLQRTAKKIRLTDLERMNQQLLAHIAPQAEELVGIDSTGYSPTHASWHYLSRAKRVRRHYLKGVYAVGCHSQLILAMRTELGPGSDVAAVPPLRRKVRPYVRRNGWCLLGDRGCDGRCVREGDLIPPMRRNRNLVAPERRARRDLIDAARLDGLYGQRWKCETVHAVIKRLFGDHIASRSRRLQWREPYWKGLAYNLHR